MLHTTVLCFIRLAFRFILLICSWYGSILLISDHIANRRAGKHSRGLPYYNAWAACNILRAFFAIQALLMHAVDARDGCIHHDWAIFGMDVESVGAVSGPGELRLKRCSIYSDLRCLLSPSGIWSI